MSAATHLGWKHGFNARLYRGVEKVLGGRGLRKFERAARNANQVNRDTLLEILKRNRGSEFGVEREFAAVLREADPVQAFRRKVPLATYEDYQQRVERMARGEQNVLCTEPIQRFSLSSGTTGKPKMVPVTKGTQVNNMIHMACMLPTQAELQVLDRGGAPSNAQCRDINLMSMVGGALQTEGGIPLGSGSASGVDRMKNAAEYMWTSPAEVFGIEDMRTTNYLHALFALRDPHARKVQAVFAPHMLEWFRCIELWFAALTEDIATGKLSTSLRLDPEVREALEDRLQPDPTRSQQLQQAALQGFDDCVHRFWPNMGVVATCVSGSFGQYYEPLKRYTGRVPIYNAMYGASESLVGMGLWIGQPNRYALCAGASFFEFIPIAQVDLEQPEAVLPHELQEGDQYEVVLTNRSGFYRYRLGDVVRCAGWHHEAPILQFEFRRGTQLDLVGEKTTEAQSLAAIRDWSEDWLGREVIDYTTALDVEVSPPRYVFYVQMAGEVEGVAAKQLDRGARLLDAALFAANPRYAAYARRRHRVGPPRLVLVSPGSFAALEDQCRELSGNDNRNQYKTPRVLRHPSLVQFMECRAVARAAPVSWFMPSVPVWSGGSEEPSDVPGGGSGSGGSIAG